MTDWTRVIGTDPDAFADSLLHSKPSWVEGSISFYDARFLLRKALEKAPERAVEIGTASGVSTAVVVHALRFASAAKLVGPDFQMASYDISARLYFDPSRAVGDAAREMLPNDLLEHVVFRNPARCIDVRDHHERDSIDFLFLDGHHGHPWPTLDLLGTLDQLRAGAVVVMHDISLPTLDRRYTMWGAKYLFDGLDVEKEVDPSERPNIGSIVVPRDKARLRDQLLTILYDHRWQIHVGVDVVTRATA